MKPFRIALVAAIFSCCLTFIFPVKTTAKVTHGTASCAEEKITQMDGGVGCNVPLKVRPPGHGGSSNPNDWGMCGVLKLSGSFGPPTVARIIIDASGYYAVELVGYTAKVIPTLDWTCVLFSDFKGVPPVSDATFFEPPSFNGGGAGKSENIKNSAGNACIWAGLAGNLTTINQNVTGGTDGAFGEAYAQFYKPETKIGSQNVTSYAFCNGYKAASWKSWTFLLHGSVFSAPLHLTPLKGLNKAHDWCYLQGIQAHLIFPTYSVGPISAGLDVSGGGNYSLVATPPGGTWVSYNCLPLKQ